MVEVCPTAIGAADITALVASRIVHEMLTGIAVCAGGSAPTGATRRTAYRVQVG